MFDDELLKIFTRFVSTLIEFIGIAAIVLGGALATGRFFLSFRKNGETAYRDYRKGLGHAILLGLELLVAADIIRTVAIDPSYEALGLLGLIIIIRTFLSFSLEVEINGRWPWKSTESTSR